ncbi:MAG: SLBB domain-containing protein [Armatimonadetes bacterium]|nr:SLBB domain-containing protein [Armatimonadota bacterium]
MRRLPVVLLVLLLSLMSSAQNKPVAKLKQGDTLSVIVFDHKDFSGKFVVLDDGSINGDGFGRIIAEGKSLGEVTRLITASLRKRLVDPQVSVSIAAQRDEFVFLLNAASSATQATVTPGAGVGTGGIIPLTPGLTVRQVLAKLDFTTDTDLIMLTLVRGNNNLPSASVAAVIQGGSKIGNMLLQGGDVIMLVPQAQVRVWVVGEVKKPGSYSIPSGSDVQKAVAVAGGTELVPNETRVFIHRGPETIPVLLQLGSSGQPVTLEPGDTVSVERPKQIRVVVDGEVNKPGEFLINPELVGLDQVVALAGGADKTATLSNVLVLRKGSVIRRDLSQLTTNAQGSQFQLEDGDLVVVRRNDRQFSVVGSVKEAATVSMVDGKEYRLADALSAGKGLLPSGTLLRVAVARPNKDGVFQLQKYNLDKFLKDGDRTQNPVLMADDVVFFGNSKGFAIADITSVLSSILIVRSLSR